MHEVYTQREGEKHRDTHTRVHFFLSTVLTYIHVHMYYIYIWGLPMKVQALELEYQELRKQINQQPLLGRI